jgi:predicted ABC-type ATPase
MTPQCFIIAGPNGAGKTTFALMFLPRYVGCVNFVNPDLIAKGLSPFVPQRAMIKAGRLVLQEIRRYTARRENFPIATTLSARVYLNEMRSLKSAGYSVHAFYLWIPSPEFAIARIRNRVESGGHDVPEEDVRRRFRRSLVNFFGVYETLVDTLHLFDNSGRQPRLVLRSDKGGATVYDQDCYQSIMREVNP